MKALAWKEWRENRLVIVWAFALMLVVLVGDVAYERSANSLIPPAEEELQSMIYFVWAVSALLCGSSMVSPEIGAGTLQFLGVLPVTRARIWWIKLAVGLGVLAACLAAAWITMSVFCWWAVAIKLAAPARYGIDTSSLLVGAALTLPLYAVGAFVSTLIDRTISALMASIVVAVALAAAITGINSLAVAVLRLGPTTGLMTALAALSVPALLAMSYAIFTRGETLRTTKRFQILAGFLLPPVVIGIACVIAWAIVMV